MGSQATGKSGSSPGLLWIVALCLLVGGCDGEQEDGASKEAGTTAAGEASRTTSTSIAFESDRDGDFELYAMDSDGTDQTRLTDNSTYDGQPAPAPGGRKVAFASDRDGSNDVYAMGLKGAEETRLTTGTVRGRELLAPAYAPDGSKIVFVSTRQTDLGYLYGDPEVFVMDSDGTNQRSLTRDPAADASPVFSPDGEKIAFVSNRDGNNEIYAMNSDGTDLTRLTNSAEANEYWPVFSPDGEKIAFTSLTGPEQSSTADIRVMDSDGTNQESLTESPAYDAQPSFSPDGEKVAFTSDRDGDFEIYTMNPDGTDVARLTNNRATDGVPKFSARPRPTTVVASRATEPENSDPTRLTDNLCYYPTTEQKVVVSPDGSRVAFNGCGSAANTDVFVANSDGTGTTNLTNNPEVVEGQFGLTFSPDSDRIVFRREVYVSGDDDIYSMTSDGTDLTNLTDGPETATEQWPTFSPDGDTLAFVRTTGPNESPATDIYTINPDGTDLTRLTNSPQESEGGPVFSPDGGRIAFTRTPVTGGMTHSDIYVMGSDGSDLTNVTASPRVSESWHAFLADGRKVAFVRTSGLEKADVYAVNLDGTGLVRLTSHPAWEGSLSPIPGTDRVAFVSPRDGDDDIYAIESDGTGLINLTDTDSASETNPAFSADGTTMAYASTRRERSGYLVNEIYVVELEDSLPGSDG
jgi:Tol biopolymer transport system component